MSLPALSTVRTVGALFLTLTAARPSLAAPTAPADSEVLLLRLREAVKARSLEDFLGEGNAHFKSHATQELFELICNSHTQRLRKGYSVKYLGHVRKRDATEQIWKLSIRDDEVESMVNLVVKDGKVDGLRIL
jgi:hypothetical protein